MTSDRSERPRRRMSMNIEGMHCASCVATIEKSLRQQPGVLNASVNLLEGRAVIEYDPVLVDRTTLERTVDATGYRARRSTTMLRLLTAPGTDSAWRELEQSLVRHDGILSVRHTDSSQLIIEYDSELVTSDGIRRTLRTMGYQPEERTGERAMDREAMDRQREQRYYGWRFVFSLIFAIPVILIMFGPLGPLLEPYIEPELVMFILATPVQSVGGQPFYRSSIRALVHGTANMDSLIMIGTTAAYLYSVLVTFVFTQYEPFYDTAVLLIAFILLGRWLEAIAKGRTSNAIRALMSLQPAVATVVIDGEEHIIPVEDVEVGYVILVRPGERVPVDGTVLEGESYVDESMISGEATPVHKTVGSEVIGSTLNGSGAFKMRASRVGQDTMLAQIIRLVENAQNQKPPIQRRADAIAEVFVPFVLLMAAATFVGWVILGNAEWTRALNFTIAVLVAACPCALGLATPTAIMVGLGRGAHHGILIKTGSSLERIPIVDTIIFDKTGTLTLGRPVVTDIHLVSGTDLDAVLEYVTAVERLSEHPLAQTIVSYADERDVPHLEAEGFVAVPGRGATANVRGRQVLVGNEQFLNEHGIDTSSLRSQATTLQNEGKTVVYAAVEGRLLAVFGIADRLKSNSARVVSILRQMGMDVWMITGDRQETAEVIARSVGIEKVIAQVLPSDKAAKVRELQESGRVVAMIGDGVNDAPALAQADVGVALGSGTDVSVEAGDIILVRDDLLHVVAAIELGRRTMSKIKQGLFWAMIYNMILLPFAAGLLYPVTGIALEPEWAGLAMALSSVSVVSNALLLNRFRPPLAL